MPRSGRIGLRGETREHGPARVARAHVGRGLAQLQGTAMSTESREVQTAAILLVDDQPARLLSYAAILGGLGLDLVSARSGPEALMRLMEREFAVVLLDVSMPGMDGFETAATIHDHPRFERTPIIFVTAVHDSEFDRLRGYKLGAVDYVSVPVVPEILRSKVEVFVELQRHRRNLQRLNEQLGEANARLEQFNSELLAERTLSLIHISEPTRLL